MASQLTIYNRPRGYDQTQKRFYLYGTTSITGTYTSGTGIAATFNNIIDLQGNAFILPPTYDGPSGPGLGVPCDVWTQQTAGYSISYINGFWRIYTAAGTELTTGTVPVAISGAAIATEAEFLRG
jgi:hypothetical protein